MNLEKVEEKEKKIMQARGMPMYAGVLLKICNALSVKMLLESLDTHGYIDTNFNLTPAGRELHKELCTITDKPTASLLSLYDKMRELFPKGNKPGTNTAWRGNPTNVITKLHKFFINYGDASEEEVLQATKNYIDSFKKKNSYSYMRVLPYFISKVEDGEEKSNLADEIMKLRDGNSTDEAVEIDNSFLEIDDTDYNTAGAKMI